MVFLPLAAIVDATSSKLSCITEDAFSVAPAHDPPQFRGIPGLIRKYYLHGADRTGGGAYLWENREAAEKMYSDSWGQRIAERFGTPEIEYFDTPLIIDNTESAGRP